MAAPSIFNYGWPVEGPNIVLYLKNMAGHVSKWFPLTDGRVVARRLERGFSRAVPGVDVYTLNHPESRVDPGYGLRYTLCVRA